MLRWEKGNGRCAEAGDFQLKNNLTGNPRHRLRMPNQFNRPSLSDFSSQHGGELYIQQMRKPQKHFADGPPEFQCPPLERGFRALNEKRALAGNRLDQPQETLHFLTSLWHYATNGIDFNIQPTSLV